MLSARTLFQPTTAYECYVSVCAYRSSVIYHNAATDDGDNDRTNKKPAPYPVLLGGCSVDPPTNFVVRNTDANYHATTNAMFPLRVSSQL